MVKAERFFMHLTYPRPFGDMTVTWNKRFEVLRVPTHFDKVTILEKGDKMHWNTEKQRKHPRKSRKNTVIIDSMVTLGDLNKALSKYFMEKFRIQNIAFYFEKDTYFYGCDEPVITNHEVQGIFAVTTQ